jgi:limonene-1,2-epoxide hydrolase
VRFACIVAAGLVLAACGGRPAPSAEAVARAWSDALDRSDDDAAARLFAADAQVIQDTELVLHTHADAVAWNRSLPCGATILKVATRGKNEVLVTFRLQERPHHVCDGPGENAAAVFRVEHGKIVLWHQTPTNPLPPPSAGSQVALSYFGSGSSL